MLQACSDIFMLRAPRSPGHPQMLSHRILLVIVIVIVIVIEIVIVIVIEIVIVIVIVSSK